MPASTFALKPVRTLRGRLSVPGDKSLSHRYVMLAALASGTTSIGHLATGADVASTLAMVAALGAGVDRSHADLVRITGCGAAGLRAPAADLDAGNSGTTLRLMAGILSGQPFHARLVGDASLSRRPMQRVILPLTAMGARVTSSDGHAPLDITGGSLHGIDWTSPVASAQVKSAILLAGLRASGSTTVREPLATRDHTERAFPVFGLHVSRDGLSCTVAGGQQAVAPSLTLDVPGDPSSAAVWATAAAAIPGSRVEITGVCLNPLRLGFVRALEHMGAVVEISEVDTRTGEPVGTIAVSYGAPREATIDAGEVPALIDELPVLAASAALGGGLTVSGASELRVKESDRITALVAGFRALGLDAEERPDGFVIPGGQRPAGGRADACGDHRLVMAFSIVALGARGPSLIESAESVAISYPGFPADLAVLVS